jgi:hypothetical protein
MYSIVKRIFHILIRINYKRISKGLLYLFNLKVKFRTDITHKVIYNNFYHTPSITKHLGVWLLTRHVPSSTRVSDFIIQTKQ